MIIFLLLIAGCASIAGTGSNVIETKGVFPAVIDGQRYVLEYRLDRPGDGLAHPLIVFTHGRRGPHPSRNANEVDDYPDIVAALARQGYTVLYLVRRGYGKSEGSTDAELKDTAYDSGLEGAKDLAAAVGFMRTSPYVIPDKIMLMGHSQGGWMAIAASTFTMAGLLGTVNISGGTNYAAMGTGAITRDVQNQWIAACGEYGRIAKVPMLWIHARNDYSIPGQTAQAMFDSYLSSGGTGTMAMKAAYGSNGHMMVGDPPYFMDDIMRFFRSVGFTNPAQPAPTGSREP